MKKTTLVATAAAALLAMGAAAAEGVEGKFEQYKFQPEKLTVKAGTREMDQ